MNDPAEFKTALWDDCRRSLIYERARAAHEAEAESRATAKAPPKSRKTPLLTRPETPQTKDPDHVRNPDPRLDLAP